MVLLQHYWVEVLKPKKQKIISMQIYESEEFGNKLR